MTVGVALTQMAIFLGLGAAAFGLQLTGAWPASIPLLIVGTLCFMAIGLLAGAVAKTTEGAVNMANFIVLPMAFLSGSFFPLDAAPGWLQALAHLLPLWWLNEGMLDVMVRGEPASAVLLPMARAGGVRGGGHRRRRQALPLGDHVTRLLLTPAARLRRVARVGHRATPSSPLAGQPGAGHRRLERHRRGDRAGAGRDGADRAARGPARGRAASGCGAVVEASGGRAATYVCDLTDFDGGRRAGRAGAGRARRRRLPRQQRRPVDPPQPGAQLRPVPRLRAHDGR